MDPFIYLFTFWHMGGWGLLHQCGSGDEMVWVGQFTETKDYGKVCENQSLIMHTEC